MYDPRMIMFPYGAPTARKKERNPPIQNARSDSLSALVPSTVSVRVAR
jgi:hypothetical protein